MKTFIPVVSFLCLFAFVTADQSLGQTPPQPPCPARSIHPFVCVMPVPRLDEQLINNPSIEPTLGIGFYFEAPPQIVYFGYVNSCSEPLVIPVGDDNFFSPEPQDRGQPTVFEPGIHYKAFVTSYVTSPQIPQLAWFVGQNHVLASNRGSMFCQNPASLMWKGPWGATREYFENDVVTFQGSAWIAKKPKFTTPQLIASEHNLNVSPVEGPFWTILSQSVPGPEGPPGPQGPVGPGLDVERFRTVTNETVFGPALAQCADNELVLTGGGSCGTGPLGALQHSAPAGLNAWRVRCQNPTTRATAFAICFPRPSTTTQEQQSTQAKP